MTTRAVYARRSDHTGLFVEPMRPLRLAVHHPTLGWRVPFSGRSTLEVHAGPDHVVTLPADLVAEIIQHYLTTAMLQRALPAALRGSAALYPGEPPSPSASVASVELEPLPRPRLRGLSGRRLRGWSTGERMHGSAR
jgi:hypothetical protein